MHWSCFERICCILTIEVGRNTGGVERKRSAAEVHALYSIRHPLQASAGRVMSDVTRKSNQAYMEKTIHVSCMNRSKVRMM